MASLRRIAPLALAVASCAGDPEGSVTVTLGEESDALSRAPAPTTLVVETIGVDLVKKEIARATLPTNELSLGDLPRSDIGALAVSAIDPAGKALLRGETLYVQW